MRGASQKTAKTRVGTFRRLKMSPRRGESCGAAASPRLLPSARSPRGRRPGAGALTRRAPHSPGPRGAAGARSCRADTAPWRCGAAGPLPAPRSRRGPGSQYRPGCGASAGGGGEEPSGKGYPQAARPRAVVSPEELVRAWWCPSRFFGWYLVTTRLSAWRPRERWGKGECSKGKRKAGETVEKEI